MVVGKWLPDVAIGEISYYEAKVSFERGSEPIALLRIVKTSDGKWEPIIREATGQGHMIASNIAQNFAFQAILKCKNMLSVHGILRTDKGDFIPTFAVPTYSHK